LVIIDRRILFLLSFNFTPGHHHSRGFGIVTKHTLLCKRQLNSLKPIVRTPTRLRPTTLSSVRKLPEVLRVFLERAKKQLLIYDPQISDKEMISVLQAQAKAGVEIRVIGKIKVALPFLCAS
jgi:hypothetical protein